MTRRTAVLNILLLSLGSTSLAFNLISQRTINEQSSLVSTQVRGVHWPKIRPHSSLGATASDVSEDTTNMNKTQTLKQRLPLVRPHERLIFIVYFTTGILASTTRKLGVSLTQLEQGFACAWMAMVLAISFLEAWVKFQAPFLRQYIAVDVGRHVFAALNAVELALVSSFWIGRFALAPKLSTYNRAIFILPALATGVLMFQVFCIAPLLRLRTKAKIVKGINDDFSRGDLSKDEQKELDKLSEEVRGVELPSSKWHGVYAFLELVKVVFLGTFVIKLWTT